jgi:hypothetical protein
VHSRRLPPAAVTAPTIQARCSGAKLGVQGYQATGNMQQQQPGSPNTPTPTTHATPTQRLHMNLWQGARLRGSQHTPAVH